MRHGKNFGFALRDVEYVVVFLNIYWFTHYGGTVPPACRAFVHYKPRFIVFKWSIHVVFCMINICGIKLYSHTQLSISLGFRIYGCSRDWQLQFLSEASPCEWLYKFIILYYIYWSKFIFPKRGNEATKDNCRNWDQCDNQSIIHQWKVSRL
jgi:hypothetical protein